MLRILRGEGQGAPEVVEFSADAAQNYSYGTLVAINSSGVAVPSKEYVAGIVVSKGKYGTPPKVEVELIRPGTLLEASESITEGTSEFEVGQLIWVESNGAIGRPPNTPTADTSFYLVLRKSVLHKTNPAPTDVKVVSYIVSPFGLKHGWHGTVS